MEDFFRDIASVYWWLLLLISLIVGIVGAFTADGIKKLWGLVSSRQRERNIEIQKKIEAEIDSLIAHPERILSRKLDGIHQRQLSIIAMISGMVIIAFSMAIYSLDNVDYSKIIGTIFYLFSYYFIYRFAKISLKSNRIYKITLKATKKLRELEEEAEEDIPF